MLKKIYTAATVIGLSALPFIALAQIEVVPVRPGVPVSVGPTGAGNLSNTIIGLVGWFEVIVWALALVMILFAALQFLTAAGNEEKVTTARRSLIWGLVGIAVALLARVSTVFVGNIIRGQ